MTAHKTNQPTATHLVRAVNEIEVCQHLVDDLESFADGLGTEHGNDITRKCQDNTMPETS